MKTVAEILSEKRKESGLTYEQIEKETKIRRVYLEAIEKNDYSFLPEVTTVKGFIRNFALAVGLVPENVLAIFRRDFAENKKGEIVPRAFSNNGEETGFRWTPKATFVSVVAAIILIFSFFFLKQYWRFSSPPSLEVFSPKEGQVFKEEVEVVGATEKDASVKIDGALINVAEDGSFKEEIVLPRGENILTVEAVNRQGKKRVVNIKVKVE